MPADTVIESTLDHPAIIGKLPAHGDFIARGVAYKARDRFDRWLSEWMELGREAHGAQFQSVYETAAPWLLESGSCTAILMPSMDAVGRLYPILALCHADCVTQDIYDCLVSALVEGTPSDDLRAQLGDLKRAERIPSQSGWFVPEGAEQTLPPPDAVAAWQEIEGDLS